MFLTTLITVGIMLLFAVPGYLLVKSRLVKESGISGFAVLLMYVCQPCLTLYAFQKTEFTAETAVGIAITFGVAVLIMCLVLALAFVALHKKYADARYRVASLAMAFGNVTFIGMPLIEALIPDYAAGSVYSNIFFVAMSLIGWTLGSALLHGSIKACKPMKILLNPATLTLAVALPLFFCGVLLPDPLLDVVTVTGRASTPLCMIVLGMRLGASKLRDIFAGGLQYIAAAVKQIVVPLLMLLIVYWLPIDQNMKISFFIVSGCPVAAVVLTFAEIFGEGQKVAASAVLVSTASSVVTLPLMLMLAEAVFGLA